jgi:multidrug efflux system outer membrane protein
MLPLLKKFLVLAVPVFLPVAGCAMGPDYTRPVVPLSDSFRMAQPASDSSSIANVPWWELLHDRELQRLVRIALEENKDLKRAVAAVEEYEARALVARMDFAPQLGVAGNLPIARIGGVRFPGFPSQFAHYGEGTLSWELDIWGRIRRANEAALGDLLAQEMNRRAVILQLVSGVAQSYFDLRQLDMQLEIAKRTLKSWQESVDIAHARLEEGVITQLDADQFEAQRANAAARTADLERQMIQKENAFSVLLGRNPAAIPRGRSLLDQALPSEVPAGLPSELLQRRPDIVQVEQQLAAATARIGAAKAERFPKITLTGILGVASPQLSRIVNPGQFAELGPALAGPLFNAQILGFQQRAVEAQARQVLAQYEQTILVAFREVEDALVAVRKTREQTLAQEEQVTALHSALELANLRYQGGVANYLDVLIAQQSLFDAELSLTATRRLHLVSIVQLYRALGGGWIPDRLAQASPDPVPVRSDMLAAQ